MTTTRRITARLTCEALESRELLSAAPITYHKGDLQKSAQVEAIYYGPSWTGSLAGEQTVINTGLTTALSSAELGTLSEDGYGLYSGTLSGSTVAVNNAAAVNNIVTPAEVEAYLSNALHNPYTSKQTTDRVYTNNASRVYLVVVDPSYVVQGPSGNSSTSAVLGYHSFFKDTLNGVQQIVHYDVVAAPGGAAGNTAIAGVISSLTDTVTATASRVLIDGMTNPDGFGWYAAGSLKEIGDSCSYVYLNNTLVVRPQTTDFARMTPAAGTAGWDPALGTSASNAPTFLLDGSGGLWEAVCQVGPVTISMTQVASNVVKVSDQGIDNIGRATVCYVTTDGKAYEYHDGGQVQLLYSSAAGDKSPIAAKTGVTVLDAKAGQGVSYVLLSNHQVWEYDDLTHAVGERETGVTAIDAGTTTMGVNMVDVIDTSAVAWEVPDRGSEHSFGLTSVIQVSAGRQGKSALLRSNHTARVYDDNKAGGAGLVGPTRTGIARVASGFSASGNYVLDLLFLNTQLPYEVDYGLDGSGQLVDKTERPGSQIGALSVSKMRAGVIDLVFADGVYEGKIDGKQTFLGAFVAAV